MPSAWLTMAIAGPLLLCATASPRQVLEGGGGHWPWAWRGDGGEGADPGGWETRGRACGVGDERAPGGCGTARAEEQPPAHPDQRDEISILTQ